MLEDINVFCAIAKHQSFAKAARELSLSTPVVTRRLARLEKTLDARLLNRTTRQVTLTEAGSLFYAEVNDILQALEASKECVKSLTSKVTGTLKVGLPNSFSHIYVTKSLSRFLMQYPELKIHIVTGMNQLNLLSNGFDLVIHCGELPSSSYHYKKLGTMKKIICASPSYLKKNGIPKRIENLQKHNCLGFNDSMQQTWKVFESGVLKEVLVSGNIVINNSVDLKNLAVNGVGIVCLPHHLVAEELRNKKLISILDHHQFCGHCIYAVYPTNKYLNKKTQIFLNFMTKLFADVFMETGTLGSNPAIG